MAVARIIGPKPIANSTNAVRRPLRDWAGVGLSFWSDILLAIVVVIIGSCFSVTRHNRQYSQGYSKRKPLGSISVMGLWSHYIWRPVCTKSTWLVVSSQFYYRFRQVRNVFYCNASW